MAGPFIIHDQCVSRRGGGTTQGARSSARMQHHDEGVSNRMDKLVEVHADLLKRYNSLSRENERLKEVNAAVMLVVQEERRKVAELRKSLEEVVKSRDGLSSGLQLIRKQQTADKRRGPAGLVLSELHCFNLFDINYLQIREY
eukprot:m.107436 g.107436  ORF g.107436 m.107436 type:complete len:143 (+) comp37299_c0_seq21:113-541(+)